VTAKTAREPAPARRRVGVVSLGCAKNLVDTEVMLGHLGGAGWEVAPDPDDADVLLVNTCAFIGPAREESIRAILEATERKKEGRVQRVVVAGCMVQRYREELAREIPEVDAFVDLDELDRVVPRVEGARIEAPSPLRLVGQAPRPAVYLYDETTPRLPSTPPWTAYVKIAEGCDHTCTFCAIPSFRGAFRSRRPSSIAREVERLAAAGTIELNLIAQDSSHYGRDLGLTEGLAGLLADLDRIDGVRWLRVHYLYPNTITERLIETMARLPNVVDYVDVPLQHAHPAVLRRMRRGGSAERHLALLGRFRAAMPEGAMRTTLIVGFPGETEEEFEALLAFVQEARFDHLGAFTYSHEEGTAAGALADDVPEQVKAERLDRLMDLQRSIALERNRARVGSVVEVLAEGVHPETEHLLVGRTRTQAPGVDGHVLLNDGFARAGEIVRVELTDVAGYDLVGRVLDSVAVS
jgi:ribosomal protein S12 methylthiotransferase